MLIILPAIARVKFKEREDFTPNLHLLYFAFLGIGFMFVEIPLIQKMILPLENSSYAIASVLTSILISSGAGSLLSHRYSLMRNQFVVLAISLLIVIYSLFIPLISDAVSPYPMPLKIASIFFILIPLGLLMGIPFPLGIKNLGESASHLIPWAWAINGCLSVLAPIIAIMLAMVIGFKAVMWIGAGAYFLAFFTFPTSNPRRD